MNIYDVLEIEEGMREVPYLCSEGYVTCGIGTKLCNLRGLRPDDFPVRFTRKIAQEFLHKELKESAIDLQRSSVSTTISKLNIDRQQILLSMAYQMGVKGLLGFNNMWKALEEESYEAAAEEMLDSRWARQTPERASRHSNVMRQGSLSAVYDLM